MLRLTRLWVDGFRNLRDVTITFDVDCLTTVILGQNGTGKSFLLEAIVQIFRNADLELAPPPFDFELDYLIGNHNVSLASRTQGWTFRVDGVALTPREFKASKDEIFPDTIFAYYSGTNNRMEALFDAHQERYYRRLIQDVSDSTFKTATIDDRRLFYARPIHGVLALLCLLTADEPQIRRLLKDMLGITDFHSAMLLLRKPWYAKGTSGRDADRFWGAGGRPGRAARLVRQHAFFPMELTQRASDDYRSKGRSEHQYAVYLRNRAALDDLARKFDDDLQLFEELESIDISDLYRWVQVWVVRKGSEDGDVSYGEMSEGERQLLTVLGLVRLSRNKRTLFLLDEPDTHLNPVWQYNYHQLIRDWAQASADRCHLIMTTHNPLMVGTLRKEEVRVLSIAEDGQVIAKAPDDDPIGIGIEGLLKSELFGLRSTLAPEVLAMIDEQYKLLGQDDLSDEDSARLRALAVELNGLGINQSHPNPYFESFAAALAKRSAPPATELSAEEIEEQAQLADEVLKEILEEEKAQPSPAGASG